MPLPNYYLPKSSYYSDLTLSDKFWTSYIWASYEQLDNVYSCVDSFIQHYLCENHPCFCMYIAVVLCSHYCTAYHLFILVCSITGRYLGCFCFEDIMNNAVMNILIPVFWYTSYWHFCWAYAKENWVRRFSFNRFCQAGLQSVGNNLYSYQQCVKIPVAPHPYQHLVLSVFLNFSNSCGWL